MRLTVDVKRNSPATIAGEASEYLFSSVRGKVIAYARIRGSKDPWKKVSYDRVLEDISSASKAGAYYPDTVIWWLKEWGGIC